MSKSLSDELAELGYTYEKISPTTNKRAIFMDGKLVGHMSYEDARDHIRREHPEYFEKEGNK